MKQKIDLILKEVLIKVEAPKSEILKIKKFLGESIKNFKKNISKLGISAEIFVGGSFAKKTVIKKEEYDIDIFIRFDKKYRNEELSDLTKKIIKGTKNINRYTTIHGSRNYYKIKISPRFFLEIIPVLKIRKPKEAKNITDLSYSHVVYIRKKLKTKKILDDIKLAKALCYANQCYGAESHISGFSGYALELLICYYGSFLKFIKEIVKTKKDEKVVIDIEKHYKNRQAVLMDLNSSKLQSPIILIDPTYKQRNALAALSEETFERFKKACVKFLKNPSVREFELKKTNLEEVEKKSKKMGFEFILLEAKTNKQEGDVAGSKLLKFYRHRFILNIDMLFFPAP